MICEIRKWEEGDAEDLAHALSDVSVQDNLRDGLPYPYTKEDARAFLASMRAAPEDEVFAFAVVAEGKVVGSIAAFRKDNIHSRTAEVGYYLAREYWNRGIMTAALGLLCEYVFSHSDILRLFAEPFADNYGSCRALEKAGFSCEGVLRKNAVKNGKTRDMKMYSRLREE